MFLGEGYFFEENLSVFLRKWSISSYLEADLFKFLKINLYKEINTINFL